MKYLIFVALAGGVLTLNGAIAQDAIAMEAAVDAVAPLTTLDADGALILHASDTDITALQWVAYPLIIFADSDQNPNFIQQIKYLQDRAGDLARRDVIVIIDTDPAGESALRTDLRPRGFGLVLIGKDGRVALRKPAPWQARELTRVIDKAEKR